MLDRCDCSKRILSVIRGLDACHLPMKNQRSNWPVWAGVLFSLFAVVSYPFVFVRWPITRDFPWANLLLFGFAALFLFVGARRALAPDRRRRSKIAATLLITLSSLLLGLFVFSFFVVGRWLPAAQGAPRVGQKAPDFILADTDNKPVSLAELLSSPINGKPAKGVLLIFYRGYW